MPDVLWPLFQRNRHLLRDLPALGAATIQQFVKVKYGVRVMIIVIPHTFGRALNFNCHLHVLVSGGGLEISSGRWITMVPLSKDKLMRIWRYALITYLRGALEAGLLSVDGNPTAIRRLLETQSQRWWSIHIAGFRSKQQLLRYAGRYVRRPAIAQHRFVRVSDEKLEFWTKDLKQKRRVLTTVPIREFVKMLAEHVPECYRHAVRYFELLAPSARAKTSAAVFMLLGQKKREPLRRLGWAASIRACFGEDPLTDSHGKTMHWGTAPQTVLLI